MPASRLRSDHRTRRAGAENRPWGPATTVRGYDGAPRASSRPRPCEVPLEVFVSSRGATARRRSARVWSRDARPGRVPHFCTPSPQPSRRPTGRHCARRPRRPSSGLRRPARGAAGGAKLAGAGSRLEPWQQGRRPRRRPAPRGPEAVRCGELHRARQPCGQGRTQDVPCVGSGEHRQDRRVRAADQRPRLRARQGPGAALHRWGVLVGQRPCASQPGRVQPPVRAA